MITKKILENTLASYKLTENICDRCRHLGFMEAILIERDVFKYGEKFKFKTYQVEVTGWFFKKTIETREQTYTELIIEKFEELLNKFEE